ncbi:hypothetical protein Ais01nite_74520 [Asanoa ishikariensis]|uniref:Uncharacterized conserved protein YndB, AHSA1/START domain n=1 Tax=Asanoa ishikariensis TaxID=137265 RepID=A0A1H3US16_9ACTN|nr:SRPBCC domain-containing protein [Asanoa ishikariensis]GIF69417.1 hypothetical protein Ais01nite_74520 [Asanoa ishikariensis]SDZ65260.1 Uncharacterized conserved protein YndB, AHSA1/START domain [Asanoa ishikariensis]
MGHPYELSKEIELAATPGQVWEAIATGPGVDSWFMGRNEVEPREGGRSSLTMAGNTSEATVTAWEPGRRFATRTETGPDGGFMAIEYLIEGRDQGSTVLRMVQSGVLGDDWETEYDAMTVGWDMFLDTLAAYLQHFPGQSGVPVEAYRADVGTADQVWAAVAGALEISGPVTDGAKARINLDGVPPIEGVVDLSRLPTYVGVHTDDALLRFVLSGAERGHVLLLSHHLFAADQDRAQAEQAWQSWLNELPIS